ncbi:MAG TPA: hypothetical protein VKA94_17150, partial [Hyphomicrobiales bacterium]|nr:hypothetical protein [Hyphomicrobiales bacterium]
ALLPGRETHSDLPPKAPSTGRLLRRPVAGFYSGVDKRAMLRFRRMRSLQKFAAVHASVSNHFNQERSLSSRSLFKANSAAALVEWRGLCAE